MTQQQNKAEATVDVNNKTYRLAMAMNPACALEERTGRSIQALVQDAAAMNFVALRQLIWLLLQKHHAAEFPTEDLAGDFIDDAGGLDRMVTAVQAATATGADAEHGR